MSALHVDLVENHWLSGYQSLHERIEPTDPRVRWQGDYLFATEPHRDEDCPFRESKQLPLVARSLGESDASEGGKGPLE